MRFTVGAECGARHRVTFNSLFEMLLAGAVSAICRLVSLSILYLRCRCPAGRSKL